MKLWGARGTESLQTPRWRGLDSNFQYAGAVNLVVAPFMPPKARDGSVRPLSFRTARRPASKRRGPDRRGRNPYRRRTALKSHRQDELTSRTALIFSTTCTRARRLIVDRTPPSHMSAVLHSGLHDATATDAKGRTTRHRAGDNPAGCRLAKLIANLGIRRPTPHYSYSDYAGGSPRHCPLCAAGRDSGSRWAGVAARSRPGRSCRSGCAHWREDLFQPIAPSISEIMPELRDRSRTSSVNQDRTGENRPTEPICFGRGKPGSF
jgi:hypothetical protein